MTRGTGIYDDEEGSAASENTKKANVSDGDEPRKDTPDVGEIGPEPPD